MGEYEERQVNIPSEGESGDGFTLESILAEYKGSAYIEGARRTPREKLDQETQRILKEARGELPPEEADSAPEEEIKEAGAPLSSFEEAQPAEKPVPRVSSRKKKRPVRELPLKNAYEIQYDLPENPDVETPPMPRRPGEAHIRAFSDMSETEQEFFGVGKYARASASGEYQEEAEQVIQEEQRRQARREQARQPRRPRKPRREPEIEFEGPEMTLRQAGAAYAKSVRPLKRRALIAFGVSLLLLYISAALDADLWLPALLKQDIRVLALTALILLFLVLYICRDLFVRGLADLFRGRAGAESLASVSALASIADAVYMALSSESSFGAPFCAVAAFSMAWAEYGTHLSYAGFRRTYKTAISSAEPYVVSPELERVKDGAVLLKSQTDCAGFVHRAEEEDGTAHAYAFAAPLLLIAALVFALFAGIHGGMDAFFHIFAALAGVSASFAALACYGLPFSALTKLLSRTGAAIAGWSGACEIRDAIGAVITDRDLFPAGTMTMNGVQLFSGISPNKALSYAGSVVLASGSGLAPLFSELLRRQGCSSLPVENFVCYEGGGIGAEIRGEKVLVGSSGFMHLMGVRVPQNLGAKNAVFAAISNELVGVFSVNYTPVNSVQNALVTILDTKILPLLAVRDFNMTPMMVQQKFKITTDKLDYLTVEARYQLSEEVEPGKVRPVALLCREGLGPLAGAIAAGRQFCRTVKTNTLITLLGTAAGLLLTFYLCWNRAFDSLSVLNLFSYLLAWLVPVLLLSGTVRRY